VALTEIGLGAF